MVLENSNLLNDDQPKIDSMAKVLITPIYEIDSIVLAINRFSIERLFLLIDKKPDSKQQKAVEELKDHYKDVVEIKEKKVEVYDIVEATHQVKEIIDDLSVNDEIYLNISTGRRTQALGVLFAAYKRPARVKKIFYVTEENKEIITIPLLSFDITDAQLKILENIEDTNKISEMSDDVDLSKAMVYRAIKELKDKGYIEENEKNHKLTQAGKIAKM